MPEPLLDGTLTAQTARAATRPPPVGGEPRVAIVIPSDRGLSVEVANSLLAMTLTTAVANQLAAVPRLIGDTYLDAARNICAATALDMDPRPTHLMWMDDDQTMPPDTIQRLLAHDLPIVGGLYHQRNPPFRPVAYTEVDVTKGEGSEFITLPDDPHGLVSVGGMGLGCCLVRAEVYTEMVKRYGDARWHAVTGGRGEDLHFFDRVRQMGLPIWLDTDVRCGHQRRDIVTTEHYEQYRRANPPEPEPEGVPSPVN